MGDTSPVINSLQNNNSINVSHQNNLRNTIQQSSVNALTNSLASSIAVKKSIDLNEGQKQNKSGPYNQRNYSGGYNINNHAFAAGGYDIQRIMDG